MSSANIFRNALIVDDEEHACRHLSTILRNDFSIEEIETLSDSRLVYSKVSEALPDILFLDIDMPHMNGIEVASSIVKLNCIVVFITGYVDYAIQAFQVNAVDFLLKPISPSSVRSMFDKLAKKKEALEHLQGDNNRANDKLVLRDGPKCDVISLSHIRHVESVGNYRAIHLNAKGFDVHKEKILITSISMSEIGTMLGKVHFFRVHRGHYVNVREISGVEYLSRRHFAKLVDVDDPVPIARSVVQSFKKALSQLN